MPATKPGPQQKHVKVPYQPKGAALDLFYCKDPEVIVSGPAGTGKSLSGLQKLHLCLSKYPKARGLMVRKTLTSLTGTGIITYAQEVLHPLEGVTFFGGNKEEPAQYRYPNGSSLVVGGLDKASKVLSAAYDIVYVQQAEELSRDDWESLTTRLRNGVMPYQQLIGDVNPDTPSHWIKERESMGLLRMFESRHEDNPRYFADGDWTEEGRIYIARLDSLTGVRKERLRYGRWVAAEGIIYDEYDAARHLIDHFDPPLTWRRIRSIDFGYNNPFVCQWFAIDPDDRVYLYRELYMSHTLVEDHARKIKELSNGEVIDATIADHDAEDRATLLAKGIRTFPAFKDVQSGIQAVQERFRPTKDGKPRLFIMRDALVDRDPEMAAAGKPTCTAEELPGYVWAPSMEGRTVKEAPLKIEDHGVDATRYAICYIDNVGKKRIRGNRTSVSPPRPEIANYRPR